MGEQGVEEGTKHAPLEGPYPHHLGWPVRKSRIQLKREEFSPRVLSLVMCLEGTMVLNTEL